MLLMSEANVKAHVSRLLSKLCLSNRVQTAILVHDAAACTVLAEGRTTTNDTTTRARCRSGMGTCLERRWPRWHRSSRCWTRWRTELSRMHRRPG